MTEPPPVTSMTFTDVRGRAWTVMDYKLTATKTKKRVPLGQSSAEGRAFIPDGFDGDTLLFAFGTIAYRDTTRRNLQSQLDDAKPVGASPGERMERNVWPDGHR